MEKLFVGFLIFSSWFQILNAQEQLCVFSITGSAKIKNKFLSKGDFIRDTDKVLLLSNSKLLAIDNDGETYQISKKGNYTHKLILANKNFKNKDNLTVRYLKFLWKEFSNKQKNEQIIAGVFRGDVLMEIPANNSIINKDKITFKWKDVDSTFSYYFFLRNTKTEELIRIEINGTELSVYEELAIFQEGNQLEWAVTIEEFPNLNNIPFYNFIKLEDNEYNTLLSSFNDFVNDLKNLGESDNEIKKILCSEFNLCD